MIVIGVLDVAHLVENVLKTVVILKGNAKLKEHIVEINIIGELIVIILVLEKVMNIVMNAKWMVLIAPNVKKDITQLTVMEIAQIAQVENAHLMMGNATMDNIVSIKNIKGIIVQRNVIVIAKNA